MLTLAKRQEISFSLEFKDDAIVQCKNEKSEDKIEIIIIIMEFYVRSKYGNFY